jgi:hypothetical protein
MQTWEYVLIPLSDARGLKKNSPGLIPGHLNELGTQGWEAVGVSMNKGDLTAWPMVLLKRLTDSV